MIMLIKAIELTLFPAVMAFAASSDLFTMTIANRVSIILVAGFALLAALTGMGASDLLVACWSGRGRAGRGLRLLCVWLDRRRRRQARGGDGALVRFRPPGRLFILRFADRRRADARRHLFPGHAAAAGRSSGCPGPSGYTAATAAFLTGLRWRLRLWSSTRTPSGWRRSAARPGDPPLGPGRLAGRRQSKIHGVARD